MQSTAPAPQDQPLNLLADWISREQLAGELGITQVEADMQVMNRIFGRILD